MATKIPKFITNTLFLSDKISSSLTVRLATFLFTKPINHKIPKRELAYQSQAKQHLLLVPAINKKINVYTLGDGKKKVLLTHGWSGRGTQLSKIADAFHQKGYQVISFDGPSHGKSDGNTTLMPEFIASIHEINKHFGLFEFAIGHSLGAMATLHAASTTFQVKKIVTIGAGDLIDDIIKDFVRRMKLKSKYIDLLRHHFEKKRNEKMSDYDASYSASKVNTPTLIIHDENDKDVPVSCAHHIHKHHLNSNLLITKDLGHNKILGDEKVIEEIINFTTS
jgi:pimeloyl-ACP methyl ester carboxylesterase